jgi:zinc transporter
MDSNLTAAKNGTSSLTAMPELIAFAFDGKGGAREIPIDQALLSKRGANAPAFIWVHLRRDNTETDKWLERSDVDELVIDALTAEETRPRCTIHGTGAIINLRGVNLNPGAEPEDMVSVRLWVQEKRVVGISVRPLFALDDLAREIKGGQAPISPSDLLARLALRLSDRAEPVVAALNERMDDVEDQILDGDMSIKRSELANIRRTAILLRRYMFPQRDALSTLEIEDLKWLGGRDRSRIREAADRVTHFGEELDSIRDRAQVIHDQVMDTRAETMNRQMLVLSVAAAIFLPLGLLTGLLGINVGGIPGASYPWAFGIVCVILLALGAVELWFFKKIGLLK